MVTLRRLYLTAGAFVGLGLVCVAVALLQNDNIEGAFAAVGKGTYRKGNADPGFF